MISKILEKASHSKPQNVVRGPYTTNRHMRRKAKAARNEEPCKQLKKASRKRKRSVARRKK